MSRSKKAKRFFSEIVEQFKLTLKKKKIILVYWVLTWKEIVSILDTTAIYIRCRILKILLLSFQFLVPDYL